MSGYPWLEKNAYLGDAEAEIEAEPWGAMRWAGLAADIGLAVLWEMLGLAASWVKGWSWASALAARCAALHDAPRLQDGARASEPAAK